MKNLAVVLVLMFIFLIGCGHAQMDRSLVNDSSMQVRSTSSAPVSPLSGLKTRSQSTGGGACSVCAH